MTGANSRQVGGEHYRRKYQHWDFVCDVNLHYLVACASKYVTRWRDKNGVQDLEKSLHYLEKAAEQKIRRPMQRRSGARGYLHRFTLGLEDREAEIVTRMCLADYTRAAELINHLISSAVFSQRS